MTRRILSLSFALILATTVAVAEERHPMRGVVVSVDRAARSMVVSTNAVPGFMAAMAMPYKVKDPQLLNGIAPGDLINATLVVDSDGAYFSAVKKVGEAPLAKPATATPSTVAPELRPGEAVPDAEFVDQNGTKQAFSAFKGRPLAITFIYTKCPLPDFCPLMDRNFVAVQQTLKTEPALKQAHLVSISFDPSTDTPAVLKKHAAQLKADPARWTFLTGDRAQIDTFASRFGMAIARTPTDPSNITHNLRTAIVDADGKLVKVYTGNDWKPGQVIADLKALK